MDLVKVGSLTVSPSDTLYVYANEPNSGYLDAWRGLYLTQGSETPTKQPTGQGGDSTQPF